MGHAGSASDARRARARLTDMLNSIQRARAIAGFCTRVIGPALLAGLGGSIWFTIWCRGGGGLVGAGQAWSKCRTANRRSVAEHAHKADRDWNPELNPEPSALGTQLACRVEGPAC